MTNTPLKFECGCSRYFEYSAPQPGTLVWCSLHTACTAITAPAPTQWTAQCLDCTFTRYYGKLGETSARTYAAKHAITRRHTVYSFQVGAFNDSRQDHTVPPGGETGDEPPF